jgi:predicted glycosyltransferase
MLHPERLNPETLAEALVQLSEQPLPARHRIPGLLNGLKYINAEVARWRLLGQEVDRAVV